MIGHGKEVEKLVRIDAFMLLTRVSGKQEKAEASAAEMLRACGASGTAASLLPLGTPPADAGRPRSLRSASSIRREPSGLRQSKDWIPQAQPESDAPDATTVATACGPQGHWPLPSAPPLASRSKPEPEASLPEADLNRLWPLSLEYWRGLGSVALVFPSSVLAFHNPNLKS